MNWKKMRNALTVGAGAALLSGAVLFAQMSPGGGAQQTNPGAGSGAGSQAGNPGLANGPGQQDGTNGGAMGAMQDKDFVRSAL
jgi:hypothetical protein